MGFFWKQKVISWRATTAIWGLFNFLFDSGKKKKKKDILNIKLLSKAFSVSL